MVFGRLSRSSDKPLDAASCAVFRIGFGALLFFSTLRFLWHGWVADYFVRPRHYFHYWGFAWLEPLPPAGMYALYGTLAFCAACVALGVFYRTACVLFALGFSYAHFCDKTNYLNHYYLVSLLSGLCVFLPLDREFSVRAWLEPRQHAGRVRAWVLYLLRFQVGVVYVFGGIGKVGSDWLLYGEPLRIWLRADAEVSSLAPLLSHPWAPYSFSWCGALFDLGIVPLLSFRATRVPAYCAVLVFHLLTAALFPIGMFPWIMMASATLFFSPDWPRRIARRLVRGSLEADARVAGQSLGTGALVVVSSYAAVQLLMPLRSWLYPGNTLWSEEGFRFAWKVMLIEKAGSLEFNVVDGAGRRYLVSPSEYLTPLQVRMAATQPDFIVELAHWIAQDFAARGKPDVRVYADCEVSFNGRRRKRLIDPERDLAREFDTLATKTWILPAPSSAPIF